MAFIILRNAPSILTLLSVFFFFYHKWVLYHIKCFFYIYWYDHVIFVFPFVYVMYYVYWFANIIPSLHPWDESHLIIMYDLLNVLLDVVCHYFIQVYALPPSTQYTHSLQQSPPLVHVHGSCIQVLWLLHYLYCS